MPKVKNKFITSNAMLDWQYMQILGELGELQRHASDPTCPCRLSKNLGEHCLAKHSLGLATLGWETAAMDIAHVDTLRALAQEAQEKHEGMRDFLCDIKDEPEFVEWSRQWRKKIERMYYRGMCKIKSKQEAVSRLHQEPKVRISGSCTAKSCALKVKGTIETVETTTAAGLPDAIDAVIRHLDKRSAGKASPLTYAIGSTSLTRYELRYAILDSKALIPSNDPMTFEPNPAYPQELQPRLRGRAANRAQVLTMAAKLDPDALLDDFHSIDRGAPIVDGTGVVLSGNGRVMAILHAISEFPKSYEVYKDHLLQAAPNYGLKAAKMAAPVLVRELVSKVDRRNFVEEANASTTIAASAVEVARSDAGKITPAMLNYLVVSELQSVEDALRSASNQSFITAFLGKLSANERAGVADAMGKINQDGIRRITMAIFVSVFPGDSGLRLAEKFFEATDINVKQVFNGIIGALGKLAQSEALCRSGERNPGLGIGDDLARAVVAYSDIKKTPGMTADKYINQAQMFERQLDKFQEKVLTELDIRARSGKKVTALLRAYADIVLSSPPPQQGALIPGVDLTKDQAFQEAIKRSNQPETAAMFQDRSVCSFLKGSLDDESKAGDEYRSAAFVAAHEGMPDVSHILKSIGKQEDAHYHKIRKLVEVNCMGVKMENGTKLPMFGTENDTDKWAVAVDGYFGLFDDKSTAEKVYQAIGGYDGDDGLAGTGFSSAQILPPHYKPVYVGGWEPSGGIAKLSEYRAIDIAGYIRKRPMRAVRNYTEKERTLAQRLADKKFMRDFFGEQEQPSVRRKPDYCTQNNGDCSTCSLVNYGRDCRNNPIKLKQDIADMYKSDPLMKTIHMQICPCIFPLLSDKTNKQKLPICNADQKAQREECIYQMKAANKDNDCKPEGDGSKRCPSPFAVCTASIGCRLGRKAERGAS